MKVDLIKSLLSSFTEYLTDDFDRDNLFKWECLQHFQENWDLSSTDLPGMFDRSLSSTVSGRLWGGSKHSAKSIMLKFWQHNPDYTSAAFRDLFDNSKDVQMRIQRFLTHCDELLDHLPQHLKKENTHYHNDFMASLYLSFRYPEKYCLYEYPAFIATARHIGVKPLPEAFNIDRFFKISSILSTFIWKNETLMDTYRKMIADTQYYQHPTQLLTYELYHFTRKSIQVANP